MNNIKTMTDFINTRPSIEDFIKEVEGHLLDLMNENPDFVYSNDAYGCFYHKGTENNPCDGCIFGQAFQRMGMLKENMTDWGTLDNSTYITIQVAAEDQRIPDSWISIQKRQDSGTKWGDLKWLLCN